MSVEPPAKDEEPLGCMGVVVGLGLVALGVLLFQVPGLLGSGYVYVFLLIWFGAGGVIEGLSGSRRKESGGAHRASRGVEWQGVVFFIIFAGIPIIGVFGWLSWSESRDVERRRAEVVAREAAEAPVDMAQRRLGLGVFYAQRAQEQAKTIILVADVRQKARGIVGRGIVAGARKRDEVDALEEQRYVEAIRLLFLMRDRVWLQASKGEAFARPEHGPLEPHGIDMATAGGRARLGAWLLDCRVMRGGVGYEMAGLGSSRQWASQSLNEQRAIVRYCIDTELPGLDSFELVSEFIPKQQLAEVELAWSTVGSAEHWWVEVGTELNVMPNALNVRPVGSIEVCMEKVGLAQYHAVHSASLPVAGPR